jgi:SAM-dependent methyltransferase
VVGPVANHSVPRRLNLGCGRKKLDGFFNVDLSASVKPDLAWNLNEVPYPLPRGHFEEIRAYDVIEHLHDIPTFMSEIHSLLAPEGIVEITTPHFSCANSYRDPTHRFHLGYFSMDYFTAGHELGYYSETHFEIVRRRLYFQHSFANRFVQYLANRYPEQYERHFAWIFPAWFLGFHLRAVK